MERGIINPVFIFAEDKGNAQISVTAAELVEKFLLTRSGFQTNPVNQLKQCFEFRGADPFQGACAGVFLQKIIEQSFIIQILRDRDL